MRIVIVDNGLAVGGTLTMTANLSKGLKRCGNHDIIAVVAIAPELAAPFFEGTAEIHHMKLPYTYLDSEVLKRFFDRIKPRALTRPLALLMDSALWSLNRLYVMRMSRLLRLWKPDLVHVNSGIEPIIAATKLGIPVVFHLHGLFPPLLTKSARLLLGKASRFIAISKCVQSAYVQAGFEQDRVDVISNFIVPHDMPAQSQREAKSALGIPDDGELVTLVGRIVPWKGPREFVAAMLVVGSKRPATRFLLVGDSSECDPQYVRELHARIAASDFAERFHFIDHLADAGIAYRASSVVVHSSIEPEPFGMILIESMAAGTPVVASPFGGPAEIIEDGISGVLVDPRDTARLAAAVIDLLENEPVRGNMIAAAKRRVDDHFSMQPAIEKVVRVYRMAIASARPKG